MSTEVLVPPVGTNVDTVVLTTWYKHVGDTVQAGEPLFAVETDKAVLDIEAPASGTLLQVALPAGAEVAALTCVAVIGSADEAITSASEPAGGAEPPRPSGARETSLRTPELDDAPRRSDQKTERRASRIFISPRAKQLAAEHGLDWQVLKGTGPEGAVVERDVRAAVGGRGPLITPIAKRIAEQAGLDWSGMRGTGSGGRITRHDVAGAAEAGPQANEVIETIRLTGIRGLIAERMGRSAAETAAVTLTAEADATAMVELREDLKADGAAVSYNDLLLLVLAQALKEHPRMNASIESGAVRVWRHIHIGLAVDTDRGLIVPVVRNVDTKGLEELARETASLVESARHGKSLPEDLRGGTFTLTNLGMYGIDAFTPIINLPECSVLGVGRIAPQPTVVGEQIVVRQRMWLSLTFDHRVVDGGPAARFFQRVVQLIERPYRLLARSQARRP